MLVETDEQLAHADKREATKKLADNFLADADKRIQFQHEYTLAGFKTLVLLNGGAIIALLTYAGDAADKVKVASFAPAFIAYAAAIVFATMGYLFAYANQGAVADVSVQRAHQFYGLETETRTSLAQDERRAEWHFGLGLTSVLLSVGGFVAGSWLAMQAIF